MRKLILISLIALTALIVGFSVRGSHAPYEAPALSAEPLPLSSSDIIESLQAYLRIDTQNPAGPGSWQLVELEPSNEDLPPETRPEWVHFLVSTYAEPLGLRWELANEGLIIHIPSSDPRPPMLWLSHVDTVPIGADEWTHPPLSATVADGMLWGRGALDNKAVTIIQLEALKALNALGKEPSRALTLLITPNEETDGSTARALSQDLERLGGPTAVLDEGSYVLPDFMSGLLVGAIAVGEKQFVTVNLSVESEGGHASMPTGQSAADLLLDALDRLRTWETPASLSPTMLEGLRRIAPARAFPESVVLGNADLLEAAILPIVQKTAAGNAVTRDTLAITLLDAGIKDNVLPDQASATLNVRLLPGHSPEAFEADLGKIVNDDRIAIEVLAWPAISKISSSQTEEFKALEAALAAVTPDVIVIPSLTPGSMDARYFGAAGLDTYRLHPFVLNAELRGGLHGTDERLPLAEIDRGLSFYSLLLQSL